MNICRLCQVVLWLFFAQWLEGRTRHVDLREHVIRHKTLKPQNLHLLWKPTVQLDFTSSGWGPSAKNEPADTIVRKDLCRGCQCQPATVSTQCCVFSFLYEKKIFFWSLFHLKQWLPLELCVPLNSWSSLRCCLVHVGSVWSWAQISLMLTNLLLSLNFPHS